jgi:hypothetical protein
VSIGRRVSHWQTGVSALFAVACALSDLAAISPGGLAKAEPAKPLRWLFAGPAIAALASDADAARFLANSQPFLMRNRPLTEVPPNWNAVHILSCKSLDDIRNALAPGAAPPGVKGILYDYEKWKFTPEGEQRSPAASVKQVAEAVHARGLLFLAAPAVDLVPVLAPDSDRIRQDETYLRLGLAADGARYADVFDIQAQRFERDAARYARFVREAAAQAKWANPKVVVLAGLSTQPGGQSVTADDIFRAIHATRNIVDGYWFNIPKPSAYSPRVTEFRPDIAIEVLRHLAGP